MSEHRFFWADAQRLGAEADARESVRRDGRAVWTGMGIGALAGAFVDTIAAATGRDTYPIGITLGATAGALTPGAYSRVKTFVRGRSSRAD
ncbi:hypothetical protein K2P56_03900 [Patescibacteria group bacterium]|nr:hypothetical protein [Patescibacteria group bacterium]